MDIVVGGGKFGLEAVKFLKKSRRKFVVLDIDSNCTVVKKLKLSEYGSGTGEEFLAGGIENLANLINEVNPEYIFPTAPLHIAAEVARVTYGFKPWNDGINYILAGLPLKIIVSVGRGSVVVSYNRDAECVPNCSAPDICPVTRLEKPCPMYKLIKFANPKVYLLISYQLKPGLGAIKAEDFKNFLNWAKNREKVLVATSCRCHGVITALKR